MRSQHWRQKQRHTIRIHLVAYAAVILLPMLAIVALLAVRYAEGQRAYIEAVQVDAVNNLSFLIDREIEGVKGVLEGLATSPALRTGKLDEARTYLAAASNIRNLNSLSVLDQSGQVLLSTLFPSGSSLPKRDDLTFFKSVFEGRSAISGLVQSTLTNEQIFIVSVPVFDQGKVAYAIGAGIKVERLQSLFAEAGLRDEWLAVILDQSGKLLARSRQTQFVGQQARPEVVAAMIDRDRGQVAGQTREGHPTLNSFRKSTVSGWTALIGVPTTTLNAPLHKSMALLGLMILTMLALALASARWMGRRIAEPIMGLKDTAVAVLDGRPVAFRNHSIAELTEVENVFQFTAAVAAERKQLQEKLEQAIDVAALGIFERDHATESIVMSPALREMLGLDARQSSVPIETVANLIAAEDRELVDERTRKAREPENGGKFDSEHRIIHPIKGTKWISVSAMTWFDEQNGNRHPVRTIGAVRDVTERKLTEERLKLLAGEMAHRSKNLLAVVQSIASQSARSVESKEAFQKAFIARVQGLAASIDVLSNQNWTGASLAELVRRHLEPFVAHGDPRVTCNGPTISVDSDAAQALGLALHELATNSTKYGALSVDTGRLSINWGTADGGATNKTFWMTWQERGGPPVVEPERKGFGHVLMKQLVSQSLAADVTIEFAPEGLTWQLKAPLDRLISSDSGKMLWSN